MTHFLAMDCPLPLGRPPGRTEAENAANAIRNQIRGWERQERLGATGRGLAGGCDGLPGASEGLAERSQGLPSGSPKSRAPRGLCPARLEAIRPSRAEDARDRT